MNDDYSSDIEESVIRDIKRVLGRQISAFKSITQESPPANGKKSGTTSHEDLLAIECRRKSHRTALRTLRREMGSCVNTISVNMYDHMATLHESLDARPIHWFSHASMVRIMAEAAATIGHIYDTGVQFEQRTLRAGAFIYDDALQFNRAARAIPDAPEHRTTRQAALTASEGYQSTAVEIIESAGMVLVQNDRGKVTSLRWSDDNALSVPVQLNMTDLISRTFPDLPSLYQLGSGAVHSKMWHLSGLLVEDDDAIAGYTPRSPLPDVIASVDAALAVSESLLNVYGEYFGYEIAKQKRTAQTRRVAVRNAQRRLAEAGL